MSDSLKDRGPQDRTRINVHEDWEVAYWTRELGVDKARLQQAVQAVGPAVSAVKKYLGI
jgi:hypothetical protein